MRTRRFFISFFFLAALGLRCPYFAWADGPLFLIDCKDATLSTALREEFQKNGLRAISDGDLREARRKYAIQLSDKGTQEIVLDALKEKYGDEELSKGHMADDEMKVANALAEVLHADYVVAMNYEFVDKGKEPEFGFFVVQLLVEEMKVANPGILDTPLAVLTGKKTGLGNDLKTAKIKAAKEVAKALAPEIKRKAGDIPKKGKSISLIIANVLDTAASIQFSKIIKDITGESPKRTYDSTQHSSFYEFPFAGDKDDFMLKLMEEVKAIDGLKGLDILDEQEGPSRISIKAMIKME